MHDPRARVIGLESHGEPAAWRQHGDVAAGRVAVVEAVHVVGRECAGALAEDVWWWVSANRNGFGGETRAGDEGRKRTKVVAVEMDGVRDGD